MRRIAMKRMHVFARGTEHRHDTPDQPRFFKTIRYGSAQRTAAVMVSSILFGLLVACGTDSPTAPQIDRTPDIVSVFTQQPPTIDGILESAEWSNAAVVVKNISYVALDSAGAAGATETHTMTVKFLNDASNLYLGVTLTDDDAPNPAVTPPVAIDVLEVYFDNDADGAIETNEDIRNFWNLSYGDWHYRGGGGWGGETRYLTAGVRQSIQTPAASARIRTKCRYR